MTATSPQSATDRDQLLAALNRGERRWLEVLASVAESAAGTRLTDNCWTILQIAEHVAAAEHGMYRALEMAGEKSTPANLEVDRRIIAHGTNRENKRQAPAPSVPKGRWTSLAECAEAFRKSRARTVEMIRTAENLRGKLVVHPLLGELDGHQLVLVMASHPERHALQIEEIKASAAYVAALSS